MRTADSVMAANRGVLVINNTAAVTGRFAGVYVIADSVFSVLNDTEGGDRSDYITAPATAVKAGAFIRPVDGAEFTAITLTSGQVAAIR